MTCEETTELLIDYIEGELPRRQMHAIEGHLEGCENCRQEAAQIEGVLDSLSTRPEDPGDPYFTRLYPRVMERIENREDLPFMARLFSGLTGYKRWSLVAAPAVLALVLAVVTFFPQVFWTGPVDPSGQPIVTPIRPAMVNTAVMPSTTTSDQVADLNELEMEALHNALMVALEDVMIEDAEMGDFGTTTVVPNDATALPSSLYELDSDDLGNVIDKLSEKSENNTI